MDYDERVKLQLGNSLKWIPGAKITLSSGELVEGEVLISNMDSPTPVIKAKNGYIYKLIPHSGIKEADLLNEKFSEYIPKSELLDFDEFTLPEGIDTIMKEMGFKAVKVKKEEFIPERIDMYNLDDLCGYVEIVSEAYRRGLDIEWDVHSNNFRKKDGKIFYIDVGAQEMTPKEARMDFGYKLGKALLLNQDIAIEEFVQKAYEIDEMNGLSSIDWTLKFLKDTKELYGSNAKHIKSYYLNSGPEKLWDFYKKITSNNRNREKFDGIIKEMIEDENVNIRDSTWVFSVDVRGIEALISFGLGYHEFMNRIDTRIQELNPYASK